MQRKKNHVDLGDEVEDGIFTNAGIFFALQFLVADSID